MIKTTNTDKAKPVLPSLEPKAATGGLKLTKLLKDEYPSVEALFADIEKNSDALLEESANVQVDGRIVFPVNADGTTIETGRVWHERESREILSSVGNSSYASVKDADGNVTKIKR